jgi:hypothetical protein
MIEAVVILFLAFTGVGTFDTVHKAAVENHQASQNK